MKMVEVFETLCGEECVGVIKVAVAKTVNNSISRLRTVNYPMTLSSEDELDIKNKGWGCFVRGNLLRVVGKEGYNSAALVS